MNLIDTLGSETTVSLGALGSALGLVLTGTSLLLNALRKRARAQTAALTAQEVSIGALGTDVRALTTTVELRLQRIESSVESSVAREELQRWIMDLQSQNRDLRVPLPDHDRRETG